MPIVYQKDAGLNRGILGGASALSEALSGIGQQRRQEELRQKLKDDEEQKQAQQNTILSEAIKDLGADSSDLQWASALSKAIGQGLSPEYAKPLIELQKAFKPTASKGGFGIEKKDELVDLFTKFGMGKEQAQREADLYASLPTGGRTAYANYFFDRMQRGQLGAGKESEISLKETPNGQVDLTETMIGNNEIEQASFQFPEVNLFQGLNNKEKASREKDLFNSNAPDFTENTQKLRTSDERLRRIGTLENLNDSDKLPEGLERANINWNTGEIRYPAFANPETQLYAKSIVDFTSTAKDDYGARITNFDLGIFLKRLPTLANSKEGRRLILEQMKSIQELDRLYYDSINEVYDHYGLRKIDKQQSEKIARELRNDKEKKLIDQYHNAYKAQEVYEARQLAPEGMAPVKNISTGKIGYLPIKDLDRAKSKGFEVL